LFLFYLLQGICAIIHLEFQDVDGIACLDGQE
jgi:hypothetical protein